MVIAYHIVFCAYGFWLPNDPRGSWSTEVRAQNLQPFGRATKTDTRRSIAHMPHDTAVRQKARDALQHPVVVFDGMQARAIARGFARAVSASGHVIRACAIMPDHVHVVVMRHPQPVEQIVTHLKTRATQQLRAESLHPFEREVHTSCWARSFWSRYLSDAEDVARSADYVNANPRRAGLKVQRWNFVKPA